MIRSIPARGSGDKDRMRTMITWLGFRHVKYGVRPHYIPIMGQASGMPNAAHSCTGSKTRS